MNRKFDFITADWHFGETRFEIMQRPFKTTNEAHAYMICRHNELVGQKDRVLLVGDAVYKDSAEGAVENIRQMNGIKTLIRGNHDVNLSDDTLSRYFEEIIPHGEGIELEVEGIPCYATHYPTLGRSDRFNLVGHIHGSWKLQLNMLNVGVDANHFTPHPIKKIPFFFKAITEFYDADVWAAYKNINSAFYDTRGKKTSYFSPKKEA
jgi:calcineurin-like phosphoesterase family protein